MVRNAILGSLLLLLSCVAFAQPAAETRADPAEVEALETPADPAEVEALEARADAHQKRMDESIAQANARMARELTLRLDHEAQLMIGRASHPAAPRR